MYWRLLDGRYRAFLRGYRTSGLHRQGRPLPVAPSDIACIQFIVPSFGIDILPSPLQILANDDFSAADDLETESRQINIPNATDSTNCSFANAYARDIERLLGESQALFLVASRAATRSQWVKYEVDWWVQNRPLEELTVIFREACNPALLNPSIAQCLQFPMYDPEDLANAAILSRRIGSFISR